MDVHKKQLLRLLVLSAALIALGSSLWAPSQFPFVGVQAAATQVARALGTVPVNIERLDPALSQLVPAQAVVEKVTTGPGFKWTEGPLWIPSGYLLFAEIPSNSIRKWSPADGLTTLLQPSGYQEATAYTGPEPGSNGMTLDSRGRLTIAGHAQRNVYRLETINAKAQKTILADSYQGKRLNSPNDLVYKSDGTLYFTDPPYGLPRLDQDAAKQLTINGVYRLAGAVHQQPGAAPKHAQLEMVVKDLPRPNGIAFSPDEKYLYVNNSEPKKFWMRYTVKSDGTLSDGKLLFDATADTRPGAPDGMKVDQKGNIYSAGPGGVWIFSPEGKHLGTLDIPERVGNVAWGGADHKTLYVAASSSIYRVKLLVAGTYPGVH